MHLLWPEHLRALVHKNALSTAYYRHGRFLHFSATAPRLATPPPSKSRHQNRHIVHYHPSPEWYDEARNLQQVPRDIPRAMEAHRGTEGAPFSDARGSWVYEPAIPGAVHRRALRYRQGIQFKQTNPPQAAMCPRHSHQKRNGSKSWYEQRTSFCELVRSISSGEGG
ncbi:hypothetical protein BCR34DRAFT_567517 [Clohesyomyces aquaticus]|uniref:Uncharacterized protein n=1 Tax=Clohesyomyces aquaticus TaxID=1231657 RepID=A0A1Y1ZIK8_9PLEO|nr:hypothetical protein BCR34DRAFT_567517 [Clohesyomyces aquaticus]